MRRTDRDRALRCGMSHGVCPGGCAGQADEQAVSGAPTHGGLSWFCWGCKDDFLGVFSGRFVALRGPSSRAAGAPAGEIIPTQTSWFGPFDSLHGTFSLVLGRILGPV